MQFHRLEHFHDARPPEQLQALLEARFRGMLAAALVDGVLEYRGAWSRPPLEFRGVLRFMTARAHTNVYSLDVEGAWRAGEDEWMLRQCGSWHQSWLRGLELTDPVPPEPEGNRYAELARQALEEEARFTTASDWQREILRGLRAGRRFHTTHKEGGTVIRSCWLGLLAEDYGDSSDERRFASDDEFIEWLPHFYRHSLPGNASPETVWRVLYRFLE